MGPLIDHDSTTDEVVAIEVWSVSKRLPPEVLATLAGAGKRTRRCGVATAASRFAVEDACPDASADGYADACADGLRSSASGVIADGNADHGQLENADIYMRFNYRGRVVPLCHWLFSARHWRRVTLSICAIALLRIRSTAAEPRGDSPEAALLTFSK